MVIFHHHHHHQPINVPTAGAQAFLVEHVQGAGQDRAITHHAGSVQICGKGWVIVQYVQYNII
jgi:hypothetical protein